MGVGPAAPTAIGMTTRAVVYAASSTAPPLVLCLDKRGNVTSPASGACPSGASKKEVASQAGLDEALEAVTTQASDIRELQTVVAGVAGKLTYVRSGTRAIRSGGSRQAGGTEAGRPGSDELTALGRVNTGNAGQVESEGTYSFLPPGYGCGVTEVFVSGPGLYDTTETSNIIYKGPDCP